MTQSRVDITHHDAVVLATLDGELDFSNIESVADDVHAAMTNDSVGLVLDISSVRYIDSAGVRMLFDIARRLDACRQRLCIILTEDSPVRRLIEITHLANVLTVCVSFDECVALLAPRADEHA